MRGADDAGPARLAVVLDDGARVGLVVAPDCPLQLDGDDPDLQVLAEDGWICPGGEAFVRRGDTTCALQAMARLDAAPDSSESVGSDAALQAPLLDQVEVQGIRRRGFDRSAEACVAPRHMRGWSEDREGLIVEVAAARSGGHRYYRVELAAPCPELASAREIQLRSGVGLGVVCGHPGDRIEVLPLDEEFGQGTLLQQRGPRSSSPLAHLGPSAGQGGMAGLRATCPVAAVHPLRR